MVCDVMFGVCECHEVGVETITEKRSKQRLTTLDSNPKTSEWSEELLERLLSMRRDQKHQYFKFGR